MHETGLRGYSPPIEKIFGDFDVSPEQLTAAPELTKEKK
jgi:hypothetical protein